MTLEEQLQMATNTSTVAGAAVNETQVMTNNNQVMTNNNQAQIQAQAQVVQPTMTAVAPMEQAVPSAPVQMAAIEELNPNNLVLNMPASTVVPTYTQFGSANQPAPQIATTDNGVQMIQLGQTVNTRHINLLKKLGIGEKIRFGLISRDTGLLKFHYADGLGKFACFSTNTHAAACCQDHGEPKIRYYLPVIVYPTMPNEPRTLIPNAHAELKVLSIWDAATYELIAEAFKMQNGIDMDFIATGADNFGRLNIVQQPDCYKSQYMADIQNALQTWNEYKSTVRALIRKNMDEKTYLNAKMQAMNSQANYNGGYNGYGNNYNNYNNYNSYTNY